MASIMIEEKKQNHFLLFPVKTSFQTEVIWDFCAVTRSHTQTQTHTHTHRISGCSHMFPHIPASLDTGFQYLITVQIPSGQLACCDMALDPQLVPVLYTVSRNQAQLSLFIFTFVLGAVVDEDHISGSIKTQKVKETLFTHFICSKISKPEVINPLFVINKSKKNFISGFYSSSKLKLTNSFLILCFCIFIKTDQISLVLVFLCRTLVGG